MSLDKTTYASDKVQPNCGLLHVSVAEDGESNTNGIQIDVHKIPSREPDWDALHNHDLQELAQRLVSLEKKTGELGYDPNASDYTQIPKTPTIPAYAKVDADVTRTFGKGGGTATKLFSTPSSWMTAGTPHKDMLIRLDRAIQDLSNRMLGTEVSGQAPASAMNNFNGTVRFGTSASYTTITDPSFVLPYGPTEDVASVITAATTTSAKVFPAAYLATDTLNEAIAKLDYSLFTEIASVRAELRALKYYTREAFAEINRIKAMLMSKYVIRINPALDIDDNGIAPSSVTRVVYSNITLKNSSGVTGTPFSIDSSIGSTVTGVTLLPGWPYSLDLDLAVMTTNKPAGDLVSLSLSVRSYDAAGNYADAVLTDKPF